MSGTVEVRSEVKTEDACAFVAWFLIRRRLWFHVVPTPGGRWSITAHARASRDLDRAVALAEAMD